MGTAMSTTRRAVLGTGLAGPLLVAHFTGTAAAATGDETWGTISEGWIELRLTPPAQAELDRLGAEVQAIAPARLSRDKGGMTIRFPVKSGSGAPSLTSLLDAQGEGTVDGGVTVRMPNGRFEFLELQSALRDGQLSGKCVVNGVDIGHRSAFNCALTESHLAADPAKPGQSLKITLSDMPVRLTPDSLRTFASTVGANALTTDTVVAHATAEGVYTPPKGRS